MFPLWLKITFVCSTILGLLLLVKCIARVLALYNSAYCVEFPATVLSHTFELKQAGPYEIAVKRPTMFGAIPTKAAFRLIDLTTQNLIPVYSHVNQFIQRKNRSSDRIVLVSEFAIEQLGSYRLENENPDQFQAKDCFVITPKTGAKGVLMIIALVFSALLFMGGFIMSILSFVKGN